MQKKLFISWPGCFLVMLMLTSTAAFAKGGYFEVTITNLTRGQAFTPILVASHRAGISLFTLGDAASPELAALAEGGDVGPLQMLLEDAGANTAQSVGLLQPGDSVTVTVAAKKGADRISVAAMLIPTNDAFFALNGVAVPKGRKSGKSDKSDKSHKSGKTIVYLSPAYDAGSEPNDELCPSIPGPACGGVGGSPGVGGEGSVHIHAGIHGIGDLAAEDRDWRNPVAKVTVTRK